MLFVDVILPVMVMLAAGYAFGRYTTTDLKPISQITLYLFSPALVFAHIARTQISSGELAQILGYVLAYVVAAALLTTLVALALGQWHLLSPLLLVSVFANSGNYGLPVLLFAYGEPGFARGVTVLAMHLILMYSVGIFFASLHRAADWRAALRNVVTMPPVHAMAAAGLVRVLDVPVPDFLYKPARLVGDATVPVVLVVLGMQLARTKVAGAWRAITLGTVMRSGVGVLLAFALVYPLGLTGLTARVLVLQHAMPTAAFMTIFAVQYNARPDLVASVTFVTTLLSFATATAVLYALEWLL